MDATHLPKSVKRIILLVPDGSGGFTPNTLFERRADKGKSKGKKGSMLLRPFERAVSAAANATAAAAGEYATRHQRSNSKKKDGWMRDINTNVMRATEKGAKRVKLTRILMPF
jgi:hypothetical protein